MPNITSKELAALEDQLAYEKVLIKKYHTFANSCSDSVLKNRCQEIASRHQTHYNKLLTYLG